MKMLRVGLRLVWGGCGVGLGFGEFKVWAWALELGAQV